MMTPKSRNKLPPSNLDHEIKGLPVNRRTFFHQVLFRGLDRIERAVSKTVSTVIGVDPHHVPEKQFLRPPGALEESLFGETCSRCGDCIRACPAQCIVLDPTLAEGLPHIVARQSPCVLCDGLNCMKTCPTGALRLVETVSEIAMGFAHVDHARCLRGSVDTTTANKNDDRDLMSTCRVCIDECPLKDKAIEIGTDDRVHVLPGCVGCGVCERVCPTEPASIVVAHQTSQGKS